MRNFIWEGKSLPYPNEINWTYNEISSEYSGRTLGGKMSKKIITSKRKIECKWMHLDDTQCYFILKPIKSKTFGNLTYPDPLEASDVTKKFYTGDPTATAEVNVRGVFVWTLTLDFIEQ